MVSLKLQSLQPNNEFVQILNLLIVHLTFSCYLASHASSHSYFDHIKIFLSLRMHYCITYVSCSSSFSPLSSSPISNLTFSSLSVSTTSSSITSSIFSFDSPSSPFEDADGWASVFDVSSGGGSGSSGVGSSRSGALNFSQTAIV